MWQCVLYRLIYVFVIERPKGRLRESMEEVTEFYTRTKTIVLQQHPHFLLAVISALLSHPTLDWVRQLHQALRLLRIRRERGRQEGHLRGIDAWDIRALLTERRRREQRREEGFREREINISLVFNCFDPWNDRLIFVCLSCTFKWHDVTKSCKKNPACIWRTWHTVLLKLQSG